jgi:hypothetical protein
LVNIVPDFISFDYSLTCLVTVVVNDADDLPLLSYQTFHINENVKPGILPYFISVYDEDEDDLLNGMFSIVCLTCSSNGSLSDSYGDPFEVILSTGVLALKVNTSLNYELQSQYNYSVRFSVRNISTSNVITIYIVDVPEPPQLVTLGPIRILETHSGFIAHVNATDDDYFVSTHGKYCRDRCNLIYTLLSGSFGDIEIDRISGAISTTSRGLDYENQDSYELIVKVADQNGLFSVGIIEIIIDDVPDCSILRLNYLSTPKSDSNAALDKMLTMGNDHLIMTGRNFGFTKLKLQSHSNTMTTVNAYLIETVSREVYAYFENCYVDVVNTVINCTVPDGIGKGYMVGMAIDITTDEGNHTCSCNSSGLNQLLSYTVPKINAVTVSNTTDGLLNATEVFISGNSFGIIGDYFHGFIRAYYSSSMQQLQEIYEESTVDAIDCIVVQRDTKLKCLLPNSFPRVGRDISWIVKVGNQVAICDLVVSVIVSL